MGRVDCACVFLLVRPRIQTFLRAKGGVGGSSPLNDSPGTNRVCMRKVVLISS